MSKGEQGMAVPCSTIANLTERSETSWCVAPEGIRSLYVQLIYKINVEVAGFLRKLNLRGRHFRTFRSFRLTRSPHFAFGDSPLD